MKVLIVYDTVSPSRVTATVAQTTGETLRERGIEVDSFYIKDADKTTVKNYDCLIAGGPTMAFRASSGIMQFLNGLPNEFSGKRAAAFDTQLESKLSGNATKAIEKKLRNLDFAIVKPPLVAYVEGKGKNQWQLKTGELEKAKNWAQEVAKALSE
jgi:menaquinone-dependent protoporphyrinogen IX oxidase